MPSPDFNDLLAFVTVARAPSFTRAALQLGVSQSALSHRIRALEAQLGLRLLNRTTRNVAPTEAGERLLQTLTPRFEAIASGLDALRELRDKPAGLVRINAAGHAADTLLWPKLRRPQDLAAHNCINLRLPSGKLLPWEFAREGRALNVQVQGQWTFNASAPILRAALAGAGLAYVPEDIALEPIAAGQLRRALQAWWPSYPGYHLYYTSRRQSSRALPVVVEALRYSTRAKREGVR